MAPIIKKLRKRNNEFSVRVCVTAQHREMLDQVLDFFEITPDYDLNLMTPGQNLNTITSSIINSLKPVLDDFKPNYVLVHGDTTTTMAASIASFYNQATVCHVEAGLRTFDKNSPFPEEINRQIVSRISDYHFAPTLGAKQNLLKENISENSILITGNTVIDALFEGIERVKNLSNKRVDQVKKFVGEEKNVILVTGHRRENHGNGFENICMALKSLAEKKENVKIVFPVHLNPKVQEPVKKYLSNFKNILLIEPLSYPDFIWLMNRSKLIITDSGGVQEEAPSLGKPVLVMRETTERPEAVDIGTVILVGTNQKLIVNESIDLLENKSRYTQMSNLDNPYGDGKAADRIIEFLKNQN